ncbi:CLUMA_CG001043, isoform A [Clunio marinus]|uniref:CLUMA_CG001043, isoform A n=1 Tax=Clunio marinus TaxID=568069 RepID=A0A1J1HLZ5_9DIPT|nr:CLUMA_CG001043, isoform A [Clunio marinus]
MLSKWIFLLFATVVMSELSGDVEIRSGHHLVRSDQHTRQTRAALKPLGFFGKIAYMGGLLFQQYNETTNAFGRIRDILQDQFSDTATKGPVVEQSTSEPDETTTEKYRISRAEFGKIVNRNLRGLQKLMRIELADAKNQSRYTKQEYLKQLYDQLKPKGGIHAKQLNLTVTNKL